MADASLPSGAADLHLHTTFSDGKDTPAELIRRAHALGISAVAVTDHDTLEGLEEAAAAADIAGIELVPGIEFSAHYNLLEVHILGLWVDRRAVALNRLVDEYAAAREERARKMVQRLQKMTIKVDFELVRQKAGNGVIGRPHLAQVLVDIGAVSSFPEAFKRFLGRHAPAYVPKLNLKPEQAIAAIHQAGGLAVLAHGLAGGLGGEHVVALVEMGLDAVEVVHPKFTDADQEWLVNLAEQRGLGQTGGSDWHGEGWSEGKMGDFLVPPPCFQELRERARLKPFAADQQA